LISALADAGEPVADQQAGLAIGAIAGLKRHDGFAIAVSRIGADDVGIDALGIEDIFVWRIRNRFTGVFVQLRLGIERFQVRDAAAEEDPDGRFGARTKMGPAVGWTIARQR